MSFSTFLSDVFATILGGAVLTLIFFLLREKVFRIPNLSGSWVYEQKSIESEYKPYKGLTLRYLVLLAQNGNQVYGSAEKIYEITSSGAKREYVGEHRSRAEITGHVEKKYFSKDIITIHLVEDGERRSSSTFQVLEYEDQNNLKGRFSSTIANQTGIVTWTRRST